ncbi:unnamed protein product [Rotaria sp. Silwood1]|nr:unnamed protein product [Rotaria sp. Silwood1]CAF1376138.1 unnamed protein product [Rotaria sp. Silwood1]CAF3614347.1 unnamed protein product [Rotaria sp. Silwood1]CAF4793745.1 unnamed protein product [Rotaria sp. Silwood1]CAF4859104.1 unnamed protein product [Rotaria sp. Silwood1]
MSCSNCNISLAGLEYVEINNKELCISCYNSKYGKICTECEKLIPIGAKYAKNGEKYWHRDCFQCTNCQAPLTNYKVDGDGKNYCVVCYNDKYASKCIACNKVITTKELFVEAEGQVFHEECFRCSSKTCGKKLDDGYIPKDNEFFCQECYNEIISTVCNYYLQIVFWYFRVWN